MLAVHFVFNMEYNRYVKDVLYFLQDKVLGFADPSFRKSSVYMNVSSAIDLYIEWHVLNALWCFCVFAPVFYTTVLFYAGLLTTQFVILLWFPYYTYFHGLLVIDLLFKIKKVLTAYMS